jgi:photosystem I subunit 3
MFQIFYKFFLFNIFLFFSTSFNYVPLAKAEYSNLISCKDSKNFYKKENSSIKKLENRLVYYKVNSKEYNSILKEIEGVKERFKFYEKSKLLCGKEGLPHLIVSGDLKHIEEFTIPGLLFLYITGWIGWSGRKYLKYTSIQENSFENEIIINVPLALSIINSGFLWPIDIWKELVAGDLLANDEDITISPR